MKIKVTELNHSHALQPFISTIPPNVHISRHCIVNTNNNEIIVKPFLSLDDSPVLRIGTALREILNTKDEYCEINAYNDPIPEARDLYIFSNTQIPISFFKNLKFIGLSYRTDKFTVLCVDSNENRYYEVTENTQIHQTNVMPSQIYGYEKVQEIIQKEIYATLFERNEFEKHRLPCSNVYVMNGSHRTRKSDLCCKVANNIHANYLQISLKNHSKNEIIDMISNAVDNTVFGLTDSFENDIAKLCFMCEFISKNNLNLHKFAFVFILENNEHVDKLVNYFDCKLEIFQVMIPIMDKNCRIFSKIIGSIPNDLTKREIVKLGKMFVGLPLTEIEEIIKNVMSNAIYQNKHKLNEEGYVLTYSSFMEVVVKNKSVMSINRGILHRVWDLIVKKNK